MSGTSADGINVAVVHLRGRGFRTRLELLAQGEFRYPPRVRRTVLEAMNAASASVAELAWLNFLLPELYAEAVRKTLAKVTPTNQSSLGTASKLRCDLVGCHGQTIYHQGDAAPFLGKRLAVTWQTGDGSLLAARLGVPVVSDFRPADMAAGGAGAPLVPYLDYLFFRHARRGRIVQNIGGIGNLTAIPAGARPEQVIACDTGPGNMVLDGLAQQLFDKAFDRNGALAARGEPSARVLRKLLAEPFFRRTPPKTAGREQFGREFVARFLRLCGGMNNYDRMATATALTAESIAATVRMIADGERFHDYFVSGGGARNRTLMRMIAERLAPLGLRIATTDEQGLPSDAKEAVAFAVLAYQTWHREPANIPSATGAARPAILGKVSYV